MTHVADSHAGLTPGIVRAIREVVAYSWDKEHADYHDQDDAGRVEHVFTALSTVASWLDEPAQLLLVEPEQVSQPYPQQHPQ